MSMYINLKDILKNWLEDVLADPTCAKSVRQNLSSMKGENLRLPCKIQAVSY